MARKKGWITFFIIFGFFMFLGVMFILGIKAALDDKPIVKKDTVLEINLGGLVTEQNSRDAFAREFEGANVQMHDIRQALALAKEDKRIRGVYLRISGLNIGWAKAQEIRKELFDFKTTGKFVTAFLIVCNEISYYIALPADEIYLQPHTYVEFNGFAAEIPFLKRMFNKLGAEAQVNSIGKYKSAGEIYERESMSPAHREATEALINEFYEEFVHSVCDRRSIERKSFENILNKGIYLSDEVLEQKLVDELKYEAEVLDLMKEKVYGSDKLNRKNRSLRKISARRYAKIPAEEVGIQKGSKIALIYAVGTILPGYSGYDPYSGRTMGSQSIVSMLQTAKNSSSVKAVVLRIDSPGGSALASDIIWAEIEEVQKKKPVIVSMSDVAASGGYWIAMGCEAIVAQPTTITGSIGVVSTIFNLAGTYDKLGIDWETVKKGEHADMLTDKRPLTKKEWEIFQTMSNDIYNTFVQKVADGREQTWDNIHEIAQGRVWTGLQAFQHGLIDSLGGLDVALALAKEKAGLEPEAPTQWIVYPQPKGLLESLLEKFSVVSARLFKNKLSEWNFIQALPAETKSVLKQIARARQLKNGEILAITPYVPVIR